ncbi:hypothetical protein QTP88_008417 [Uroleucon formosanum]
MGKTPDGFDGSIKKCHTAGTPLSHPAERELFIIAFCISTAVYTIPAKNCCVGRRSRVVRGGKWKRLHHFHRTATRGVKQCALKV